MTLLSRRFLITYPAIIAADRLMKLTPLNYMPDRMILVFRDALSGDVTAQFVITLMCEFRDGQIRHDNHVPASVA